MKHDGNSENNHEPRILAVAHIDSGVELHLSTPQNLTWFDGHFPEAPILPGVVQIDWALELGRRYLGIKAETGRSFQVKFRKVFGPGEDVRLFLEKRGTDSLRFEYRRGNELLSSGCVKLFGEISS